ncbi:hypothetical protein [Thermomonospora amylolytica]|uniref:hypothetical protein n=1 Tax=Thermomonospora amylolytica TaxID=1411117 RepID=UPI000E6D0009|nr:hypothetical protein [Thermomonospora amylolytica]
MAGDFDGVGVLAGVDSTDRGDDRAVVGVPAVGRGDEPVQGGSCSGPLHDRGEGDERVGVVRPDLRRVGTEQGDGRVAEIGGEEGGVDGVQGRQGSAHRLGGLGGSQAVAFAYVVGDVEQVGEAAAGAEHRDDQQVEQDRVGAQRGGPACLAQVAFGAGRRAAGDGVLASGPFLQVLQRMVNELGAGGAQPGGLVVGGGAAQHGGEFGGVLVLGLGGGQVGAQHGPFPDRFAGPGDGDRAVEDLTEAGETGHQQVADRCLAVGAPSRPDRRPAVAVRVPGPAQRCAGGGTQRGIDQGVERGEGDGVVMVGQMGDGPHTIPPEVSRTRPRSGHGVRERANLRRPTSLEMLSGNSRRTVPVSHGDAAWRPETPTSSELPDMGPRIGVRRHGICGA